MAVVVGRLREVRSFEREEPSLGGPRWITQVRLRQDVLDLGDAYVVVARSWCARQPFGPDVLRFVDRRFRHVTLSLVNIPAEARFAEDVTRLEAALVERLAGIEPITVRFGPAIVNAVAIELYLQPSPKLAALQACVADAYRAVFPGMLPPPWARRSARTPRSLTAQRVSTMRAW